MANRLIKKNKTMTDKNKGASINEKAAQKNKDEKNVAQARIEAEKDVAQDPELSIHHPNDDLDEGETARLGEDKTGLV
jgi:hypothetical protein